MTEIETISEPEICSTYSDSVVELLSKLKSSLIVTTYQAGKIILVRVDENKLNTHFRNFPRPMGCVSDGSKLIVGGSNTIWHYRNLPDVAAKLDPAGKYDAAFLAYQINVTGDIDVHEITWTDNGQLWIVNTQFSCICTLDNFNSFIPKWRPYFISSLSPEDRCHINGVATQNGQLKYLTALGESDDVSGWRVNKRDGGILMDIPNNKIILKNLSMPHSPRWHNNKLWVLESGKGSLSWVDIEHQKIHTVASVPGFTRGVDFEGKFAFIGLSQVRDNTKVFSGLPITESVAERNCGVWIVNIENGKTVGFVRFESGVQEIFSVQLLRNIRFPEIISWTDNRMSNSYTVPEEILKEFSIPRK